MSYTPERTLSYKTYIKRAMVQALRAALTGHPDPILAKTNVSVEYPREQADYPAVLIKFYERKITNAGLSHSQYFPLYQIPTPVITSTSGPLNALWYEYRISFILTDGSETEASQFVRVTPDQFTGSTFTLTWTPGDVQKYRVYRRSSTAPQHVYWETTGVSFVDDGSVTGTAGAPLGPRRWKHYMWSGDFEFAVYTLSNLDRDLVADTLVQTILFGDLEAWTNAFYARLEPSEVPDHEAYPGSQSNFVVLQSDDFVGYGESQTKVPWESEDDLIYQTSYRVAAYGEFYNLPSQPKPFIEQADLFPYEPGRDVLPTGDPNDQGVWIPAKPATQADIDAELADKPPFFT